MAEVKAVCISERKGTMKHEVPEIKVRLKHGIEGDAHAGDWHRQISLLGTESVDKLRHILPDIPAGAFAENILTEGITLYELPIGTAAARGRRAARGDSDRKRVPQGLRHQAAGGRLRHAARGHFHRCGRGRHHKSGR